MQKRNIRNAFIYTVLGFLPVASQFFLTPVLTSVLSLKDYGIINLTNIIISYASIFITLGIDSAFSIFYFKYFKRRRTISQLLSTSIISILIIFSFVFFLTWVFSSQIFEYFGGDYEFSYARYGVPAMITTISTSMAGLFINLYRNDENIKSYTFVAVSLLVLALVGQLFGVLYFKSALGTIWGRAICSFILVVFLMGRTLIQTKFYFSFPIFKKLLVFGIPFSLYILTGVFIENYDKLKIEFFFGKEKLAIYAFATIFIMIIEVFRVALLSSINPALFRYVSSPVSENPYELSKKLQMFSLIVTIVCSLTLVATPVFISLFINSSYLASLSLLPILILGFLPRIYISAFLITLQFHNKTYYLAAINVIAYLAAVICVNFSLIDMTPLGIACLVFIIRALQMVGFYLVNFYFMRGKFYGFNYYGNQNYINFLFALLLAGVVYANYSLNLSYFTLYSIQFGVLLLIILVIMRKNIKTVLEFIVGMLTAGRIKKQPPPTPLENRNL